MRQRLPPLIPNENKTSKAEADRSNKERVNKQENQYP
jgi:hypothetical protein